MFGKERYRVYLALCFIISAAAIHLRLSLLFVTFAGIAASLLTRKFKITPLLTILSVVMLVSLFTPYYFIETDISEYSEGKIYYIFSDFTGTVLDFFFKALPASISHGFQNIRFNVLYLPVLLSLLTALITSVKLRKYLKLQILFVCFMTYGLILVYGTFNPRFLIIIMPLVFIVMIDSKHFRSIAYLFIFACISSSLWSYYDGIKRWEAVDFWSHVSKTVKFDKEDTVMISGNPRMSWFFTGISPEFPQQQWRQWDVYLPREKRHGSLDYGHVELYEWDDLKTNENIYLGGHKVFTDLQASRIKKMAAEHDRTARFELVETYDVFKLFRVFITPINE